MRRTREFKPADVSGLRPHICDQCGEGNPWLPYIDYAKAVDLAMRWEAWYGMHRLKWHILTSSILVGTVRRLAALMSRDAG